MSENHAAAAKQDAGMLVRAARLEKTYVRRTAETRVLKHVNLDIRSGEQIAIVGPSGAGKSTLLHILGTLDRPTSGEVLYRGENLFANSRKWLAGFRNRKLGFIFQFHHLLPEFTALENALMPSLIAGEHYAAARRRAADLLDRMGLARRLSHKPGELSGGEQQRVAVARALVMRPEIVLADEPTGNLDTHTGEEVFNLLMSVNSEMGMTLIVVTHNEQYAGKMQRCITLVDGELV